MQFLVPPYPQTSNLIPVLTPTGYMWATYTQMLMHLLGKLAKRYPIFERLLATSHEELLAEPLTPPGPRKPTH